MKFSPNYSIYHALRLSAWSSQMVVSVGCSCIRLDSYINALHKPRLMRFIRRWNLLSKIPRAGTRFRKCDIVRLGNYNKLFCMAAVYFPSHNYRTNVRISLPILAVFMSCLTSFSLSGLPIDVCSVPCRRVSSARNNNTPLYRLTLVLCYCDTTACSLVHLSKNGYLR